MYANFTPKELTVTVQIVDVIRISHWKFSHQMRCYST